MKRNWKAKGLGSAKTGKNFLSVYLLGSKCSQKYYFYKEPLQQDMLDVKSQNYILYNRPFLGTIDKVTRTKLWRGGCNGKYSETSIKWTQPGAKINVLYFLYNEPLFSGTSITILTPTRTLK